MKLEDFAASGSAATIPSPVSRETEFWDLVADELGRSRPVLLAVVASCRKGSPGTPGAKMLVLQDGQTVGTIGGGIMEARALERARATLDAGAAPPMLVEVDHQQRSTRPSGLICGGGQINAFVRIDPSRDCDTVRRFVANMKSETPSYLEISPEGLTLAKRASAGLYSQKLQRNSERWKLEIGAINLKRCAIFGAGHCGRALARQMRWLGYNVSIFDARPSQRAMLGDWETEQSDIGHPREAYIKVRFPQRTAAIVMTHSYESDIDALGVAIEQEFPFIGLMGSPPKLERIRKSLANMGCSQTQIDRIVCPVGLKVGSDTPEEIAVSIAAQILSLGGAGQ